MALSETKSRLVELVKRVMLRLRDSTRVGKRRKLKKSSALNPGEIDGVGGGKIEGAGGVTEDDQEAE